MTGNNIQHRDAHSFALVLGGISEPKARIEDALFEAGCDDALLAFRNGVAFLEFDREADSFESAILSAVKDVENAREEITVSHVEPDDVVNASEIARRLHWSREYVRLLVQGSRGEGGFPPPSAGVTGKTFLWSWAGVLSWLVKNKKLEDRSRLNRAETIRDINVVLLHPAMMDRHRYLLRKLQSSS